MGNIIKQAIEIFLIIIVAIAGLGVAIMFVQPSLSRLVGRLLLSIS